MATKKSRSKKKKKILLSPEDIQKRAHRKEIRSIFSNAGFTKVFGVSDKEFTFKGRTGDMDDVFICENIIVLIEYTCSKSENIGKHLLPKKVLFDNILKDKEEFIKFYEETFNTFKEARNDFYDYSECKLIILYCSRNTISQSHKDQLTNIIFFDYSIVKYFKSVTDSIKLSSKFELFKFLGLNHDEVGKYSITSASGKHDIMGTILPESHSNFEKGFKVVSFYIDPNSLLTRSYVLRKDSWRDEGGLYQRMIIKSKIKQIRKHLHVQKRVFINNIIVTLPSTTKLLDESDNTVNPSTLTKTQPVKIQIPDGFNVIGLIDGQHRVFAYHEGGEFESEITKLRVKQNLLVTGIIYPKSMNEVEKSKFEAKLFLEINSNQANAKSDLKQAIGLILNPFSSESIARAVIHKLNTTGPLQDLFERHFYDNNKIKTTSIVSYGLKPIVKLSGIDSFYTLWKEKNKDKLAKGDDMELLNKYIDFCAAELNVFLGAFRKNLDKDKWTFDKEIVDSILSTSTINGIIICLRSLIENGKTGDINAYNKKLSNLNLFNFLTYKSSQYGSLAKSLYETYFAK